MSKNMRQAEDRLDTAKKTLDYATIALLGSGADKEIQYLRSIAESQIAIAALLKELVDRP